MAACEAGNLECVKTLVENGAKINLINSDGHTALTFACVAIFGSAILSSHLRKVRRGPKSGKRPPVAKTRTPPIMTEDSKTDHDKCILYLLEAGAILIPEPLIHSGLIKIATHCKGIPINLHVPDWGHSVQRLCRYTIGNCMYGAISLCDYEYLNRLLDIEFNDNPVFFQGKEAVSIIEALLDQISRDSTVATVLTAVLLSHGFIQRSLQVLTSQEKMSLFSHRMFPADRRPESMTLLLEACVIPWECASEDDFQLVSLKGLSRTSTHCGMMHWSGKAYCDLGLPNKLIDFLTYRDYLGSI
jgi:hypothetical protein